MAMDENRPLTKKELKQLRRLEKLDRASEANKQNKVKWIVIGLVSVLFLAFFVFLVYLVKAPALKPVAFSDLGYVRGGKSAKVTLVEFGDFQCPACKVYFPIVKGVTDAYGNRIKLLFKEFPLTNVHQNSLLAAKTAEAAGLQGKFFEMHDLLYEKQEEWSSLSALDVKSKFISYAESLGLDIRKFELDLDSDKVAQRIKQNQDEGIKAGVNGTPTFFINGVKIANPPGLPEFKKIIDDALNKR